MYRFDQGALANVIDVFERLKNRNNIAILTYSNGLYYGSAPNKYGHMRSYFPTGDVTPFVNYCVAAAERIHPYCRFFEIYNEPDIGHSTPDYPKSVPVPDYIKLLKATYERLKPLYPKHKIIAPAMAWENINRQHWPLSEWVDLGGLDYCDGFSYHPYRYSHSDPTADHSIRHLDAIHDYLVNYGGREVDIYITEVGWPTSMFTAEYQWQQFERLIELCHKRPWIKGLWWYDFMNDCSDMNNRECTFGLYDQALLKKYTS